MKFRENIIAESIPPLEGVQKDWEIDGTKPIFDESNKLYPTYVDTDLHTVGTDRELCQQHLRHEDGTADSIEQHFRDVDRILPDSEQERLVRYRRVCFGCDALGKCGMKIVQYDAKGNQIT